MNVFSSDPFLRALAGTYYPDRPADIAAHRVEGHAFRLLRIDGKPLIAPAMVDFWEPVARPAGDTGDPVYALRSLPRVALASTAFTGEPLRTGGLSAAPFVDLRMFATWDDFEHLVRQRRHKLFQDSARQVRRLEHEVGPVVVALADDDDDVIDRCVAWRATRFRSAARMHRDQRHVEFLRALRDRGIARVSSFRAGGRVMAAVVGLRYEGRYSYWITAYDDAFGTYSPGRLLLERLIAASLAGGDVEFDLLVGSEAFKWHYATHARLVGPLGRQPALASAVKAARRRLRLGRKYLRLRKALGL